MNYTELFGDNVVNNQDGRALRDERYKLIQFQDGHDEFYDLQSDPYEGTNLLSATLSPAQQQHRDRLEFWFGGFSTNAAPRILGQVRTPEQFAVSVAHKAGATYGLWRCADPVAAFWSPVSNATVGVMNSVVTLTDPSPPAAQAFYAVMEMQ